jgi:DNA-binding NarL/FixJ family response regulator
VDGDARNGAGESTVNPVRILIADDHDLVRQGVRAVLEEQEGWTVCCEANTGREAVSQTLELRPDVVVLDASMPELNGVEAARQIRRVLRVKIIILTMHDSDQLTTEVLEIGAQGYVLKSDAGRMLVDAVRAVLDGKLFIRGVSGPVDRRQVFGERVDNTGEPQRLTPREREVLQLLTEGKSNKEVATSLGITVKTAETHRAHIMAKLKTHSIAELVRYAIRNHITNV